MRFGKLDLNLLVALNALLEERSVSRAADRLNISQPAMSAALAKLREFFNDDLLVRSGREMVPTAQAAFLVRPVTEVLTAIQHAMNAKPTFDPGSAKRVFRIMMSDYIACVVLPHLLQTIEREAPGIKLEIVSSDETLQAKLERREIDLAIVPDRFAVADHPSESIIEDSYVVVVDRQNRQIGDTITLEDYVASRHVVASTSTNRQASFEDWFLEHFNVVREAAITVPSFSLLPRFIVDTQLIATMHARLARSMTRYYGIRIVDVPENFPKLRQSMQWHRLSLQDLGLEWLRAKLHEAVAAEH